MRAMSRKSLTVIAAMKARYTLDAFMSAQPSIDTIRIKGRSHRGIDSFMTYCKNKYPGIKKYVVCPTTKRRKAKEMQVVGGPKSTDEGMNKINAGGKSR